MSLQFKRKTDHSRPDTYEPGDIVIGDNVYHDPEAVKEWRDEEWWHPDAVAARRAVGEQFGIADPNKVMAQVNEICATRLP